MREGGLFEPIARLSPDIGAGNCQRFDRIARCPSRSPQKYQSWGSRAYHRKPLAPPLRIGRGGRDECSASGVQRFNAGGELARRGFDARRQLRAEANNGGGYIESHGLASFNPKAGKRPARCLATRLYIYARRLIASKNCSIAHHVQRKIRFLTGRRQKCKRTKTAFLNPELPQRISCSLLSRFYFEAGMKKPAMTAGLSDLIGF